MMPDPVSIKKRTGFGTHILPWLGPGLVSQDCEAECLETNNSEAPAAVIPFSMSKSGQVLVRTYTLKYVEFPKV